MSFCNLSLLPSSMRQVQNQVANTFLHLQNFFYEILKMYKEDAYYTKVWEECSKDSYQSEISYLFHDILWGTPLLLNLMKVDFLVKFDETRNYSFQRKFQMEKLEWHVMQHVEIFQTCPLPKAFAKILGCIDHFHFLRHCGKMLVWILLWVSQRRKGLLQDSRSSHVTDFCRANHFVRICCRIFCLVL